MPNMVTENQIKAARALLGMRQFELAERAGVSIATVNNIERGVNKNPHVATMKAILDALEEQGIVFTHSENEISVSLRKKDGDVV